MLFDTFQAAVRADEARSRSCLIAAARSLWPNTAVPLAWSPGGRIFYWNWNVDSGRTSTF